MQREEWESLLGCPGWAAMKRYFHDYREAVKEQLAVGKAPHAESVAMCTALADIINMDFDSIENFYRSADQVSASKEG